MNSSGDESESAMLAALRDRADGDPLSKYECAPGDVANVKPSKTTLSNVISLLYGHASWVGVLQLDEFSGEIRAVEPPIELEAETHGWTDNDTTNVRTWLELRAGFVVSKEVVWDAVYSVARRNRFHVVREYLDTIRDASLVPGAIDAMCSRAMHIADSDDLSRLLVRKFLIQAVARIFDPGCQGDYMLVLFGPGGVRKTSFVRALFFNDRGWMLENLADLDKTKDCAELIQGKWGVEIGELKDLLRAGDETSKSFVTRCSDKYRPAYARHAVDQPRQCVFVGTTNEEQFLRDATGNRRYWVIRQEKQIDTDWLHANRHLVWAEAAALYAEGERAKLTAADEARVNARNAEHEEHDAWHARIAFHCVGKEYVTFESVRASLGIANERFSNRERERISKTLRRLGCVSKQVGKHRLRVWSVPDTLRDSDPVLDDAVRAGIDASNDVLRAALLNAHVA